jgi:hypothetical protein
MGVQIAQGSMCGKQPATLVPTEIELDQESLTRIPIARPAQA